MMKEKKRASALVLAMTLLLVAVGTILPSKEAKAASVATDGYTVVTQADFDEAKAHAGEQVQGNPVSYQKSKSNIFKTLDMYQISASKVRFAEDVTLSDYDAIELNHSVDVDLAAKLKSSHSVNGNTITSPGTFYCVGENSNISIQGIGQVSVGAFEGAKVSIESGDGYCLEVMSKGKIVVNGGSVATTMFSEASSNPANDGSIEIRGGTHTNLWIETSYENGSVVKIYGGTFKNSSDYDYAIRLQNTTYPANEEPKMDVSAIDQLLADGYEFVGGEKTVGSEDWGTGHEHVFAALNGDNIKVLPIGYEEPTEQNEVTTNSTLADGGDGNWYLFTDGVFNPNYTGLFFDANVGWWLVVNGRVAFEYNDLYGDANYGWWKITNGAVDFGYTDLYCSPTCGWWKVNGGAVDFGYSDLYYSPTYGWWLVYNGAVNFEYNDLFGSPQYGWWKVTNGTVDFNYADLYCSPTYGWWLVYGGAVIFDYSDLFGSPQYGWWKVNGGAVDFGYTGVYESPAFGPWNINGGAVVF